MKPVGDDSEQEENPTIRMPKSLTQKQRLQAIADRAGGSGFAKVERVWTTRNAAGEPGVEAEVKLNLSAEQMEWLVKQLTIKPFSPDKDTVTLLWGRGKTYSSIAATSRRATGGTGAVSQALDG